MARANARLIVTPRASMESWARGWSDLVARPLNAPQDCPSHVFDRYCKLIRCLVTARCEFKKRVTKFVNHDQLITDSQSCTSPPSLHHNAKPPVNRLGVRSAGVCAHDRPNALDAYGHRAVRRRNCI